ncbi:hypothetical protein P7K49_029085, partial [Saguinus oedipus]
AWMEKEKESLGAASGRVMEVLEPGSRKEARGARAAFAIANSRQGTQLPAPIPEG